MTFSWFSVAVLLAVAAFVLSGMIKGARKGFIKTLASFISLIVSLIISLVISPRVSQIFGGYVLGFIKTQPFYGTLLPSSAYIDLLLTAVSSMIISSVFFLVILAVLNLIFTISFKIIYSGIEDKNRLFSAENAPAYERNSKTFGAALGAVSGFLTVIIMFAPITGSLRMTGKVLNMIDKAMPDFFAAEAARREFNNFKNTF